MITRIQARNYKCLKDVDVRLSPFQVLVGPNGSGKSTFMDVLRFIGDMLGARDGLNTAAEAQHRRWLNELIWNGEGGEIEFTVTLEMPPNLRARAADDYSRCRYHVAVRQNSGVQGATIVREDVWTLDDSDARVPVVASGLSSPNAQHTRMSDRCGPAMGGNIISCGVGTRASTRCWTRGLL